MPTPVSTARQCLAADAASALSAAVSAAARRQHAQTTSLHVIFALLSPAAPSSSTAVPSPSPVLRDALSRARSAAFSPRLQFKALEFCFGVALDRLPSSSSSSSSSSNSSNLDEPPISNSLMAAIKRSQANQRRHPDTFHYYQQQAAIGSSSSSFSGVKVELQQLIIAILDDPIVSRVFGEAGFRSGDIKMAVLRPPPPILRFPRSARCPPMFLCNFSSGEEAEGVSLGSRGFSFPFSEVGDENCRRIGEIMGRKSNRNPMLVGVGACEAARDFVRALERKSLVGLPMELSNLKFVSIEKEVLEMKESKDFSWVKKQLEELGREEVGVVMGIGDLKGLLDLSDDLVNCLVAGMKRVLEVYRERLWVMGWSTTYETYMKFLSRYPMLDKDWDLQLQLITSTRPAMSVTRPQSLMESFVPFGGFFPTTYESNIPVMKPCSSNSRCQHCTDMYEQELAAILKGCTTSSEDQRQTKFPWLQSVDMVGMNNPLDSPKVCLQSVDMVGMNNPLDSPKIKDDEKVLNARVTELQKKWNDYCQRLHQGFPKPEANKHQVLPPIIGLPIVSDKDRSVNPSIINPGVNKDLTSKLQVRISSKEPLQNEGLRSHRIAATNPSTHDERPSPPSISSVTTDLVLGTLHKPKACGIPSSVCEKFDLNNFKAFRTSFLEKVGRQDAAVYTISHKIVECKAGHERRRGASLKGDIWFSFLGPDRLGKKKAATVMAELMFGSRENIICFDLGYQDDTINRKSICEQHEFRKHDVGSRGKTIADQIAGEISKKPSSVVFIENVEKADFLVQDRLSQAIRTGKISDSHGREFGINNAIFVVTTNRAVGKTSSPKKETVKFCEEDIMAAQRWQMKISIESLAEASRNRPRFNVSIISREEQENKHGANKRKLDAFLDLNLPLEEEEACDDADCSSSGNSIGGEEQWVDEILTLMDENVNFEPFDFDSLADYMAKEIGRRFCSTIGSDCLMEIDVKVMQQILAATWLLEDIGSLNNWIENVLINSFIELRRRHSNKLSAHTVVRLWAMEETFTDEHAHGVLLPSRIILD